MDPLDRPVLDDGFGGRPGEFITEDDLLYMDTTGGLGRSRTSAVEPMDIDQQPQLPEIQVQPLPEEDEELTQIISQRDEQQRRREPVDEFGIPFTQPAGEPMILDVIEPEIPQQRRRRRVGPVRRRSALVSTPTGFKRIRIDSGPVFDESIQIPRDVMKEQQRHNKDITRPMHSLAPATREIMRAVERNTVKKLFELPSAHYPGRCLERYAKERIYVNSVSKIFTLADDRRRASLQEVQEPQQGEELELPPIPLELPEQAEQGRARSPLVSDVTGLGQALGEGPLRTSLDGTRGSVRGFDETLPPGERTREQESHFFEPRPSFTQADASQPEASTQEVSNIMAQIREEILLSFGTRGDSFTFQEYTAGYRRRKAAQTFTQLLHLHKDEVISLEQRDSFGPLTVALRA